MNADETQLKPDAWSGYGGVGSIGSHDGSPTVSSLPSLSPSWMAVIGRQKCQYDLSFQQMIAPSAPATLAMANSRASSARVSPSASATVRSVRLYISTV